MDEDQVTGFKENTMRLLRVVKIKDNALLLGTTGRTRPKPFFNSIGSWAASLKGE